MFSLLLWRLPPACQRAIFNVPWFSLASCLRAVDGCGKLLQSCQRSLATNVQRVLAFISWPWSQKMEIFDIRLAWPTVISQAGAESPIHRVWIRYDSTRRPRRPPGRQRAIRRMCDFIRPRVCRTRDLEGIMAFGCPQGTRCRPVRHPNTLPNITTISNARTTTTTITTTAYPPGGLSPIELPPFPPLHMTKHRQHGARWTPKPTGRHAQRCLPGALVTDYAFPCRLHVSTTPNAIRAASLGNNDARLKNTIPL